MTKFRHLEAVFRPRSVALVGADAEPRSMGSTLARNLFAGEFAGPIAPVHPTLPALRGVMTYPTVADLPFAPDLAVVASKAAEVPEVIAALGRRGAKAAVVLSADFGDPASEGGCPLRRAMVAAAREHALPLVGPACLGVMVPPIGLNASYAPAAPRSGDVAVVTQSGSMMAMLLDLSRSRGVGFSLVASLGDMDDVEIGDVLDFLAADNSTRSILLAISDMADARQFLSAARTTARAKPVIVFDAGRRGFIPDEILDGDALRPSRDAVFDAAFRRAGMLPVPLITDLIAAANTLGAGARITGDRLGVVANGRTVAEMTANLWLASGGGLGALEPADCEALDAVLPAAWERRNPVNVFDDANAGRWRAAVTTLLACRNVDGVLAVVAPTAIGEVAGLADAIADVLPPRRKPVAVAWLDGDSRDAARARFAEAKVPVHELPRFAVTAFAQQLSYRRNQEMLTETPASTPDLFERDDARARDVVRAALAAGRDHLDDSEAASMLAAYGLAVATPGVATTPEEAAAVAARVGFPVAVRLRVDPPTDAATIGGIALDLEDGAATLAAAVRMLRALAAERPDLKPIGFSVFSLVRSADGVPLRLALSLDPKFGPVIVFGQGGNAVRMLRDEAVGLPPLNLSLARALMSETRAWWELSGASGRPAANLDEVALALVRLSQMAVDLSEVVEIDINPMIADASGVLALSARILVAPPTGAPEERFAIRPYPTALEKTIVTRSGQSLFLRPIRPEDEPALQAFVARMSPEDVRLRFFSPLKALDHRFAARLTQIDYDREMAFVALDREAKEDAIWGVMRVSADARNQRAEYAGSVRSDLKGHGLGRLLMEEIIAYCRQRGVAEIWGEVLSENAAMLALARKLGFTRTRDPDDPSLIHLSLKLKTPA